MGKLLKDPSNQRISKLEYTFLLSFVAMLLVIPILYMFSAALKTPGEFSGGASNLIPASFYMGNFEYVLKHPLFLKVWYTNSVKVVLILIGLRFLITVTAAYAFARLEFKFKNILFFFAMAVMMIPTDATLVGRYLVYKNLHIVNSSWALILPGMADVLILFMMRQFFMVLPKSLTEASVMDGCTHLGIYFKIILPLAKPALMTMALFTFIWNWNDFTNPSIFIADQNKQMLTVGLSYVSATANGVDLTKALAGAVLAIIPTVVLFSFSQKYFITGIASTGIKG